MWRKLKKLHWSAIKYVANTHVSLDRRLRKIELNPEKSPRWLLRATWWLNLYMWTYDMIAGLTIQNWLEKHNGGDDYE